MSLNKTELIGHLGRDPEIRYTPDGTPVASVSLATSDKWKDKSTGESKEKTEWHRVIFYNRLAEIVGEYLKQGSQIYLEGKLRTRKYTDKNGVERYITEVVGNELKMLDKKPADMDTTQTGNVPLEDYDFSDDVPF